MSRRYATLLNAEYLTRRYASDGASVVEIAAETGTSANAVYGALRRQRIPLRGVSRASNVSYASVLTADYLAAVYVERGDSMEDIAAAIGCQPATVMRWLRRHGITTRPARAIEPRVYTDLTVAGGSTPAAAAAAVGAARSTAGLAYRRAGVQRPKGRPRIPLDTDRIDSLRAAGWTHKAIAADVGCSAALVGKYLAGRRP